MGIIGGTSLAGARGLSTSAAPFIFLTRTSPRGGACRSRPHTPGGHDRRDHELENRCARTMLGRDNHGARAHPSHQTIPHASSCGATPRATVRGACTARAHRPLRTTRPSPSFSSPWQPPGRAHGMSARAPPPRRAGAVAVYNVGGRASDSCTSPIWTTTCLAAWRHCFHGTLSSRSAPLIKSCALYAARKTSC